MCRQGVERTALSVRELRVVCRRILPGPLYEVYGEDHVLLGTIREAGGHPMRTVLELRAPDGEVVLTAGTSLFRNMFLLRRGDTAVGSVSRGLLSLRPRIWLNLVGRWARSSDWELGARFRVVDTGGDFVLSVDRTAPGPHDEYRLVVSRGVDMELAAMGAVVTDYALFPGLDSRRLSFSTPPLCCILMTVWALVVLFASLVFP